jgi:hypothetical protein
MEPNTYKETRKRLGVHLTVGVGMLVIPLPFGLEGLFAVLFILGVPVTLLSLWAVCRRLFGLSEYVRVSDEAVDYVDPLRSTRRVTIPLEEIRFVRCEKKAFGITGKKKELAAIVELEGGRKLTLTERFLPPVELEMLVKDVDDRMAAQGLANLAGGGDDAPSAAQGEPSEPDSPAEPTEPDSPAEPTEPDSPVDPTEPVSPARTPGGGEEDP